MVFNRWLPISRRRMPSEMALSAGWHATLFLSLVWGFFKSDEETVIIIVVCMAIHAK